MHDGSITFSTALDNAQLEKDLAGLTKKIEKQERKVADLSSKRDAAKEKGVFDAAELDAEKAKLEEIKDRLAEIRAMAKDKSLSTVQRNDAKDLIPAVQAELKEQQTRVSALQTEWNKTENAVARYSAQLADAENALDRQKSEAGYLQQQIDEATRQAGNMNFAAKTLDRLKAELKELEDQGKWFGDEDYDRLYGELIRVTDAVKSYRKEVAQSAAYMQEMADSAGISDQRVSDLGQELALLKGRLSELKKAGIGFGHKEFDDIYAKIVGINKEIKEYERSLTSAASVDFSGAAAKKAADELFQGASDHAAETMKWISRLQEELDDLQARKSSLGLALGAKEEYDQIQGEIDSVTRRLENMRKELDELARSGALGGLASGSEIAEQRIAELKGELADLQDQQANLGLALGAKQEYDDLSAEIERVSGLLEDYKSNLNEEGWLRLMVEEAEVADQHIVDLCQELDELKARQDALGRAGIGLGYQEYDDNAARISDITKELNAYQKALRDTGSASAQAAERMASIMSKLTSITEGGSNVAMQEIGTAISGMSPQLMIAVETVKLLKIAMDEVTEAAANFFRSFVKGLHKGVEVLKGFGKSAVKAFQLATEGVLGFLDKVNIFPKMFSSIGKSLKRLGQMIRRVFVFSVITAGLRTVRSQMSAYLIINTEFSNALGQLKGVLLTAFQPIYDVVVPALTVLMNLLARAIATITQFTAVLFGTTAKQAQKNAQALYKQAQATSAAGSAAEEASSQLASFDEINKLQDENSGGGAGAGADTGPLFDWEYEDTPFPDWGEAFDAFLDKILGNIPRLKDALKDFAGWFNDLTKKTYDMFTFPGVLEKVERLGRELADAFNGLVVQIDWYQLGQAMGAGLNLALQLLTEFIYTFDWIALGMALATMVNGLVAEVDWYDFGRLLWFGFKIGLETLAGFLLGLDMPQLAQAASNIVMGFFDEMKNTIQRIPWNEIGAQIAEFLVNLDWYGMLSNATTAIAAGLMAAVSAVRGFLDRIAPELDHIAREIVTALIEFFRDEVEWDEMARTIGNGITAALHFVADLLDPELFYEIGRAIGDFFINLQWVEIFGGLTEALANGINAAIAALKGFLDSVTPEKLKEIADGIAQKINEFVEKVDWAELGKTISRGIEAALDFMIELMDRIDWDAIGAAICEFLENIDWETLLSKWGTLMGKMISAKLKMTDLSGILDVGVQIVAGLAQGMLNKFNESGGILGWLKSLLVNPIIDGVNNLFGIHSPSTVFAEIGGFLIEGLFNGISEIWHTITDFFSEKLDALKQSFSEAWENIKTAASEKWSAIKEALSAKWGEIQENAKTKFDEIKGKISEVWENTKTAASQKWDEIKSTLATAWDNVKTSADEKFTNIKESIVATMGKLKDHDWKGIGSTIMNGIWDGLKKIWDSVTNWASTAASFLGNIFSGAKSAASGIMGGATAGVNVGMGRMAVQAMPNVSAVQIPALAQGAVIPPNREFMAILGDQTSGNNLEGPESLFRKIVREEAGGNNTALLEAILEAIKAGQVIMVDRKVLGRVARDEINRATRASGKNAILT